MKWLFPRELEGETENFRDILIRCPTCWEPTEHPSLPDLLESSHTATITMISRVEIQNYRSFVDTAVDLRPFTLVVGPNGGGKTNFLRLFRDLNHSQPKKQSFRNAQGALSGYPLKLTPHFNFPETPTRVVLVTDNNKRITANAIPGVGAVIDHTLGNPQTIQIYTPDPSKVSMPEKTQPNPRVHADGSGTTQVLESLRLGDDEERFEKIEAALGSYVPEIEKLSIKIPNADLKQFQVREKGILNPVPGNELSEGSRIVLCLLTILYQSAKPSLVLVEDIDRALHPRLLEQMMELFQRLAEQEDVQIIATTHNPYLVDFFDDDPASVVIVEKEDGISTLATLDERLRLSGGGEGSPEDLPLGTLWFSGLLGGTPNRILGSK